MYVEPEVSTLVLILYLACKLYQSHLQKTVTSLMILLSYPNIPDIVWKQWYMENSTDQIWPWFCIWSVYCSHVTGKAWWYHWLNYFSSLTNQTKIEGISAWRTWDIKSGPCFVSGLDSSKCPSQRH